MRTLLAVTGPWTTAGAGCATALGRGAEREWKDLVWRLPRRLPRRGSLGDIIAATSGRPQHRGIQATRMRAQRRPPNACNPHSTTSHGTPQRHLNGRRALSGRPPLPHRSRAFPYVPKGSRPAFRSRTLRRPSTSPFRTPEHLGGDWGAIGARALHICAHRAPFPDGSLGNPAVPC